MIIERKYELLGILYSEDPLSRQAIDRAFAKQFVDDETQQKLLQYNSARIPAFFDLGCEILSICYDCFMSEFERLDREFPYDNGLTFKDVTNIEYETSRKGNAIQMRFVKDGYDLPYRIVAFAALENIRGEIGLNDGWEMAIPVLEDHGGFPSKTRKRRNSNPLDRMFDKYRDLMINAGINNVEELKGALISSEREGCLSGLFGRISTRATFDTDVPRNQLDPKISGTSISPRDQTTRKKYFYDNLYKASDNGRICIRISVIYHPSVAFRSQSNKDLISAKYVIDRIKSTKRIEIEYTGRVEKDTIKETEMSLRPAFVDAEILSLNGEPDIVVRHLDGPFYDIVMEYTDGSKVTYIGPGSVEFDDKYSVYNIIKLLWKVLS